LKVSTTQSKNDLFQNIIQYLVSSPGIWEKNS